MTRKDELLAAFDDAWGHKWESLESALNGATEEEVMYRHYSYADEPPEEEHPPAGTILWHLVHLAHCYRNYAVRIEHRPHKQEDLPAPSAGSLSEAIDNLKRYRKELRKAIERVPEPALEEKLPSGEPIASFVRSVVRHDAWHAAQIVVVRRLWRTREK